MNLKLTRGEKYHYTLRKPACSEEALGPQDLPLIALLLEEH
jgi:hypothetical protein